MAYQQSLFKLVTSTKATSFLLLKVFLYDSFIKAANDKTTINSTGMGGACF